MGDEGQWGGLMGGGGAVWVVWVMGVGLGFFGGSVWKGSTTDENRFGGVCEKMFFGGLVGGSEGAGEGVLNLSLTLPPPPTKKTTMK